MLFKSPCTSECPSANLPVGHDNATHIITLRHLLFFINLMIAGFLGRDGFGEDMAPKYVNINVLERMSKFTISKQKLRIVNSMGNEIVSLIGNLDKSAKIISELLGPRVRMNFILAVNFHGGKHGR